MLADSARQSHAKNVLEEICKHTQYDSKIIEPPFFFLLLLFEIPSFHNSTPYSDFKVEVCVMLCFN